MTDAMEELKKMVSLKLGRRMIAEEEKILEDFIDGMFMEYEKANVFVRHIKNHFSKEHPDWKVCCKICNKDIDEIYERSKVKK